jgi:pimeloyl-ACP methyl ester carboxylesterase
MFTTRSERISGFTTSYIDVGQDRRGVILLVHDGAFGTTAELCWGSTIEGLVAAGYRVVAPDLLGWGGSDKVVFFDRSPYVPRVQQLSDLCEHLSLTDVHAVGVSFGASVLLRSVAAVQPSIPAASVIALSGTGGPFRLPSGIEALADYEPTIDSARRLTGLVVRSLDGLEAHVEQRLENSLAPGHYEAMVAPRVKVPGVERERPADTFLEDLRSCGLPVLLVEGAHDQLLEPGWSTRLADILPRGRALVLPTAHEPNIDEPEVFLATVLEFIEQL